MSESDIYRKQGFGNSSGFGVQPALLVVDFVNGFNDPDLFGGGSAGHLNHAAARAGHNGLKADASGAADTKRTSTGNKPVPTRIGAQASGGGTPGGLAAWPMAPPVRSASSLWKLSIAVKMASPFWRAVTERVSKEPPSRSRVTW